MKRSIWSFLNLKSILPINKLLVYLSKITKNIWILEDISYPILIFLIYDLARVNKFTQYALSVTSWPGGKTRGNRRVSLNGPWFSRTPHKNPKGIPISKLIWKQTPGPFWISSNQIMSIIIMKSIHQLSNHENVSK